MFRCADHALTSPTCGSCSVGIVRLRTKTTEFVCCCNSTCFDQCGHHQVLKFLARKLLSSVVVYVVKYRVLSMRMCV
jgi:hypothetical protein